MARADAPGDSQAQEDPELVAAIRAGDLETFERIVRQHGRALLALARRLLRDEDEAREALQDAFVSAFRARDRFEGTSHVGTWLHRIVINTCLMRLRKRSRAHEIPIDHWLPAFKADGHHETAFIDWSEGADAMIEREELCAHVRASIDRLPDGYREVLVMREIEGLTIADIAAAMEISPNAAKIRLHRARQALRTLLDPSFIRSSR